MVGTQNLASLPAHLVFSVRPLERSRSALLGLGRIFRLPNRLVLFYYLNIHDIQ
jgi:hypothetical protein